MYAISWFLDASMIFDGLFYVEKMICQTKFNEFFAVLCCQITCKRPNCLWRSVVFCKANPNIEITYKQYHIVA